ncbi:16S rRNA (uracil(1498)-N(3))-methyltransferase [Chiayiivirga flava]|uniref:Ribosomal RNA small subunit methyltransferase E n=1 Tax=Chiayiivirga flava TaxID=659595 RepID=A0A7W8D6M2_9GAMM|nr:16S rRNA (uracil(1498)-N(3))-methyltransferase [Chiayiivirga flava]MBB5207243.1 16S rRNA (uracil1498-N3)-methyltransferase [Chiayiivirga flava]
MRLTRNHVDAPLAVGATVALDDAVTAHLVRVLRLGLGDALVLFNGDGFDYEARLVSVAKRGAQAEVMSRREVRNESPLRVVLAQAIARGDRMDWVLQKATELGVAAIVPIVTERTEVKLDADRGDKRMQHWRGVVAAACEQCGRTRVPELHAPVALAAWLADPPRPALVLCLDPQAERSLRDVAIEAGCALVIGPEGGFGERDLHALRAAGAVGVRLGPRVLRTETAGLAALAALQMLGGDFG